MVEGYGAQCALCVEVEGRTSNSYWNGKLGMLTVLSQQHAGKARSVITTSDPWNLGRMGREAAAGLGSQATAEEWAGGQAGCGQAMTIPAHEGARQG